MYLAVLEIILFRGFSIGRHFKGSTPIGTMDTSGRSCSGFLSAVNSAGFLSHGKELPADRKMLLETVLN